MDAQPGKPLSFGSRGYSGQLVFPFVGISFEMKHRGGGNKRELGIQLNWRAASDATGVQSEQQMIAHGITKNEI